MDFPSPQFADEYSWVSHARSQGYSTLALDNLGSGNSSGPDPITIVQGPLQVEIMHNIIKSLRSGSLPNISQHYKKVVFVTHSYGSIIGRKVATDYPTDGADAYILTAASNTLVGIKRAIGTFQAQAASVRHPAELGNLPPGYLSFSNQGLRDAVYSFNGDFDPKMLAWDQQYPHSFAAGEVSAPLSSLVANTSTFDGPVMVLTGKYDVIVCGTGNFTQSDGDCGNGKDSNPAMTKAEFPKARFDYYIPDHTGHDLNAHYSAPESFGAAHMFLEKFGF
jgi:pimeloyl-ACP methyl ester carboxylesterase